MNKNNVNDIMTGNIDYIIIPLEVRNDERLTANAKLLYGDLLFLSHRKGYCFASNSYLAKRLNTTPRSVIRWVQELKDTGYVTAEYRRDGKMDNVTERRIAISNYIKKNAGIPKNVNDYINSNVVTELSQGSDKNVMGVVTELSRGYCQNCHGGSDKNVTQKNNILRIKDKNNSRRSIETAANAEKELERIEKIYRENIGELKPIVKDNITQWLDKVDADVIVYAIQEAVRHSVCKWKYVDKVISNHFSEGRTSIEQIENTAAAASRKASDVFTDNTGFDYDSIEEIMRKKYDK